MIDFFTTLSTLSDMLVGVALTYSSLPAFPGSFPGSDRAYVFSLGEGSFCICDDVVGYPLGPISRRGSLRLFLLLIGLGWRLLLVRLFYMALCCSL